MKDEPKQTLYKWSIRYASVSRLFSGSCVRILMYPAFFLFLFCSSLSSFLFGVIMTALSLGKISFSINGIASLYSFLSC